MISRNQLLSQIQKKRSFLCVGLDSEWEKLPGEIKTQPDAVFRFNKAIIDSTEAFSVAYKLNTAFYESQGKAGWDSLFRTLVYLKTNYPDCFVIADAKRADIGNTSRQYAECFFGSANPMERFDAITVAPYMGFDSVQPFLEYPGHWVILLGLTSNPGSADFQFLQLQSGRFLFEEVLEKSGKWGNPEQLMIVAGATRGEHLRTARSILPDHFFLIPGIGAKGGSLEEVCSHTIIKEPNILVNSSRNIIFASPDRFEASAQQSAKNIQIDMQKYLDLMGF